MRGSTETLLKAKLDTAPKHPRALATFLEALSLWQGVSIRAALAVGDDENPWCDAARFHVDFADFGQTPLYSIELVSRLRRRQRRRDSLGGVGDFRDLRQLMLFDQER
jgi:hypothetical protein